MEDSILLYVNDQTLELVIERLFGDPAKATEAMKFTLMGPWIETIADDARTYYASMLLQEAMQFSRCVGRPFSVLELANQYECLGATLVSRFSNYFNGLSVEVVLMESVSFNPQRLSM